MSHALADDRTASHLAAAADKSGKANAPAEELLPASLGESFRIQCRVIKALFLREVVTRYGRRNIGFLWLFVDPMIFTGCIALIWNYMRTPHFHSVSMVAFALTGYTSIMLWRNMPGRTMGGLEPNRPLLYHRAVRIFDVYLARIFLEIVGVTLAFVFMILLFSLFGWMELPVNPLQVVIGWSMLAWFGFGLALLLGAWSEQSKLVEKIWAPISYISFLFSGALFFVDQLPPAMQTFVVKIPMVHGVEYIREGFFGPVVRFHYDLMYLLAWNLGLTLLGLAQVRYISRTSLDP